MNNETKHTPEPWAYKKSTDTGFLITANNAGVARTTGLHYDNEENARRIVACVNFCAGQPTETIERLTIDNEQPAFIGYAAQRDELAAALREFVADCDAAHGKAVAMALSRDWPDLLITYTKAKAALAKL